MKKEINEIIEKNLPANVGNVLRTRLEQADKDAEELSKLKVVNEEATKRINVLEAKIEV